MNHKLAPRQADIDLANLVVQLADDLGEPLEPEFRALAKAEPAEERPGEGRGGDSDVATAVSAFSSAWRDHSDRFRAIHEALATVGRTTKLLNQVKLPVIPKTVQIPADFPGAVHITLRSVSDDGEEYEEQDVLWLEDLPPDV